VPTFVVRGCRVVSAADPLLPYSRFPIPELLLFLPSISSVVLTRLSGPHSRPTTQKIRLLGCLHPVACTRSGSGFPSNATLQAEISA
jgi:hypothetical protein